MTGAIYSFRYRYLTARHGKDLQVRVLVRMQEARALLPEQLKIYASFQSLSQALPHVTNKWSILQSYRISKANAAEQTKSYWRSLNDMHVILTYLRSY